MRALRCLIRFRGSFSSVAADVKCRGLKTDSLEKTDRLKKTSKFLERESVEDSELDGDAFFKYGSRPKWASALKKAAEEELDEGKNNSINKKGKKTKNEAKVSGATKKNEAKAKVKAKNEAKVTTKVKSEAKVASKAKSAANKGKNEGKVSATKVKKNVELSLKSESADSKVEGWNLSYRERVEKALAVKGLVVESAEDSNEEVLSATTAIENFEDTDDESEEDDEKCEAVDESEEESEAADEEDVEESAESEAKEVDLEDAEDIVIGGEEISDDVTPPKVRSLKKVKVAEDTTSSIPSEMDAKDQAEALMAAIDSSQPGDEVVLPENQRSLKVGIIGAPNAGKSALLNHMVGGKVSAVSRKTNTTQSEILGVLTESDAQLLFYDTPGLMLDWKGQAIRQDLKNRVHSAWNVAHLCELLMVLVDADRHIERPDPRVTRLINKLGREKESQQKRILCLNKVDLIRNKRALVPLAQKMGSLPGFDRVFMISGLRGSGVRHLKEYLMDQAVLRPWEEKKGVITDMTPVMIAKEIVWEHILDNLHQELPYELRHRHVSWKVLKDGSIRIEQQLLVQSESQKKIVVGKHGAIIRKIGMLSHSELCSRLGKNVHLILDVKVSKDDLYSVITENEPMEMWM